MPPPSTTPASANFGFLAQYEVGLVSLAAQAETLFAIDPAASIGKTRLLAELLAQESAARIGLYTTREEPQSDLLRRLRDRGALPREVEDYFHSIRRAGNEAVHRNAGDHGAALHALKLARVIAVWFVRSFGKDRSFKPAPFEPPRLPADATDALRAELAELRDALAASQSAHEAAQGAARAAEAARLGAEERARLEATERAAAEALMEEAAQRESDMLARLAQVQASALVAAPAAVTAVVERAANAEPLDLDEASTRRLIDEQLRAAGWEVDTATLRWSEGTRPRKGANLAIAEVPTEAGPADYVLFVGLTPMAVVEAKRAAKNVSEVLKQSARYARAFRASGDMTPVGPFADAERERYRVPFLFSSNGRPYLKQVAEGSGVWFRDARNPSNLARPLVDWYTPEGLLGLLRQDIEAAHEKLEAEPTDYLNLRGYQLRAIAAAEHAIEKGARSALLAMATGVGKTRTCIGLCYRLLKTGRFRRILFLVDRSALGEQTANAFKDARLESLQTFDSIFDMKTLDDVRPDAETKLHIATIQGMVKRVLYPNDDASYVPPVDAYDCVVVDECHRGYLLDREMSEGEQVFRSQDDYFSKYSRVLDYFDAVKIGLTATPALHTVEIFGQPVFTYSYREAVVDGFLVDHEPPTRIVTALAEDGITFLAKEKVEVYKPTTGARQLMLLPDEVRVDIEQFNKQVHTENFNRVVCQTLANHIDPTVGGKTLIFCTTDFHADMVVRLLKEAFAEAYGSVEDDAVIKITGTSDRPLELIRRFKNERQPNVAVTVDLLTTGVDVPTITNIVFLRRVRSRILYEQMLGRATRLCEDLGDGTAKEVFHIYDAVDLYSALEPYSSMKPIAQPVSISFTQLLTELAEVKDAAHREEVFQQLVVKLDRKRRHLDGRNLEAFEQAAGQTPAELLAWLRQSGPDAARAWLGEHADLGMILDRPSEDGGGGMFISTHADGVRRVERGYGDGKQRPDAYLDAFAKFLREHLNDLPALLVVTQRPRELTREQLKSLALALDKAGYPEAHLRAAWRDRTNQDIAASIIGHIRQAALGDALVPYPQRVDRALKKILGSRAWTAPQRKWLERIGHQLEVEVVVDRSALDRGQFAAQGGFDRMNKVFDGKLEGILGDLVDEVWKAAAKA